ncbi:hypothetical protein BGX23_005202 [Mortierella sp. AD031]|nr:hypothetical protein BGX23_005202 [Mortierella sp. AD031]
MPVKTTTLSIDPVLVQKHELTASTTTTGKEYFKGKQLEQTFSATILTYGATLTHLTCPDRWNRPLDVVLGFDNWEEYLAQAQPGALNPYFGATIGPTASRIANATFQLDSTHVRDINTGKNDAATPTSPTTPTTPTTKHVLQVSNGLDCHHGGPKGFDKQHWTTVEVNQEETSVTLEWISPHGDYGYPGRLVTHVQYRLTGQGELTIEYSAQLQEATQEQGHEQEGNNTETCDKNSMDLHSTIVSLTNHTYWNLDGVLSTSEDEAEQLQALLAGEAFSYKEEGDKTVVVSPCTVKDHTLWLSTSTLIELGDKHPVPTGMLIDVKQTPELHVQKELLDFTSASTPQAGAANNKPLGPGLDPIPGRYGYDHVFALDGTDATHPTPVPVTEVGIQAYWPRTPLVATLYSPMSGIRLDLSTSEPALVLYAAGYLDKSLLPPYRTKSRMFNFPDDRSQSEKVCKVKVEAVYEKFSGLCLEPIRYPDAIHHRDWAKMVSLHHDQMYRQRSVYKFSTE